MFVEQAYLKGSETMYDYNLYNLGQERVKNIQREAEKQRLIREAQEQGRVIVVNPLDTVRSQVGKVLIAAGEYMVSHSGVDVQRNVTVRQEVTQA
jgi:hypothetical protein